LLCLKPVRQSRTFINRPHCIELCGEARAADELCGHAVQGVGTP